MQDGGSRSIVKKDGRDRKVSKGGRENRCREEAVEREQCCLVVVCECVCLRVHMYN